MPNVLLEWCEVSPGCKYAIVTLNRPAAKNALNKALSEELAQALNSARIREDVRCVVLIGAGGCFSAGAAEPANSVHLLAVPALSRLLCGLC